MAVETYAKCFLVDVTENPFDALNAVKATQKTGGLFGFGARSRKASDNQHIFQISVDGISLRRAAGGEHVVALEWKNIMRWSAKDGVLKVYALSDFVDPENATADEVLKLSVVPASKSETAAAISGAMQGMAYTLYHQQQRKEEAAAEEPRSPQLMSFDDEVCHSPLARNLAPASKSSKGNESPFNPRAIPLLARPTN